MISVEKLQNVCRLRDGTLIARCPACAEQGHDSKGEHLILYADGKFGCVANPGDKPHRQRVWALAGERLRPTVNPAPANPQKIIIKDIFSRLRPATGMNDTNQGGEPAQL